MADVAENAAAASVQSGKKGAGEPATEQVEEEKQPAVNEAEQEASKQETKKEEVATEVEPKTGVSFPAELDDGKKLLSAGLRKRSVFGMGIKIYAFGLYADTEKLKDLLKTKFEKAPSKPTKEMFVAVIDGDAPMVVRLVMVVSGISMNMVRKGLEESLGASIKKLTGKKDDEIPKRIMGQASDDIKLTTGSVIEVSRLPGHVLQTKVMDQEVGKFESQLLCRAFIQLYIGDDPFDKDAKEKFGTSSLSLF